MELFCISTLSLFFPVPSLAPNITAGFNKSSTSLFVEWDPLPLDRDIIHGYLLGYTVELISTKNPQNSGTTIKTGPDELSKDITDLQIYTTYCVRVAGRTRIGPGNWSECHNITTDDEGEAASTNL